MYWIVLLDAEFEALELRQPFTPIEFRKGELWREPEKTGNVTQWVKV